MPYGAGERLPGERASRLGHLEVLKSPLVNKLVASFEGDVSSQANADNIIWQAIQTEAKPLSVVFGIDGSFQTIESERSPNKRLAFVKTALLRLDQSALSRIDREAPNPFALRDILANSAIYHSTVFPLKHITLQGIKTYNAVLQIVYESFKDASLDNEIMETFKWIVYEKWSPSPKNSLEKFECPHCRKTVATLPYNAETGNCPECGESLYVTDMLGFHQEMTEDSAPDTIANTYMSIHETLMLFTGIRHFWNNNKRMLSECLFVKDGPLSIRAQYSKLVNPIRRFLAYARDQGINIHIIGQEKSGRFYDHLELIGKNAPPGHYFLPKGKYIKEEIQNRPDTGAPYGKDTNFGVKVFIKMNDYHKMVLNIPTGEFTENPEYKNLIGAERIFATIPKIISNRYEGALLPIELANGIASLSTYPSAQILKIFSDNMMA